MRTLTSAALGALLVFTAPTAAQETNRLERLVISAGQEKIAIETPQSVSVVNQEDLDSEQALTLGDVLNDLPGVKAIGSDRVLGESFNIRGIGSLESADEPRLIIQVDGATKFYEQYRMGSFFSDPELYKRVEVLRGPASSTLYGAGALAGVISLTTKDAADYLDRGERLGFRQKLEGHSNGNGFLSSSILAARPADGLDLLGAFVYRRSSLFEDGAGREIPGSDFTAPSALLKGAYRFGAGQAHTLKASYQHWTTDDKGAQYAQTNTTPLFGEVDREVTDQTAILGYAYQPDHPLLDLNLSFSYSNTEVIQTNASLRNRPGCFSARACGRNFNPFPELFNNTRYAYETLQGRLENTFSLEGAGFENYLTVGVGLERQTRRAEQPRKANNRNRGSLPAHPGGQTRRTGVYAQNELILWDRLTLIPGLRLDYQTVRPDSGVSARDRGKSSDRAFSPKLAAHYALNRHFGLFGSLAYTERLPVLDELYDGASGNLGLKAEESFNYEGGLAATFADAILDEDRLAAKLTLFRNDVKNLIERRALGRGRFSPYFNRDEAEIQGLEFEAAWDSPRFFARAAYTLIRGKDGKTGRHLDSIPADELALNVGARIPRYGLSFGWRGVFAARQDRVSGLSVFAGGRGPNPGYAVHDVYISWVPEGGPFGGLETRLGIDNIFDRDYREHLADDNSHARGRSFKLSLVKQF